MCTTWLEDLWVEYDTPTSATRQRQREREIDARAQPLSSRQKTKDKQFKLNKQTQLIGRWTASPVQR